MAASEDRLDTAPLFSPFSLKGLKLRNRFIVPSMQRFPCVEGVPSAELAENYRRLIQGGFAMVMSESCAIDHPSASRKTTVTRMLPSTQSAWRDCIQGVNEAGGELMVQLWHEGAMRKDGGRPSPYDDAPTISPSGLVNRDAPRGRMMSLADMVQVKKAYVRSALLAQDAGAAGVEIHAAHGFLLDQFLWPATNLRTDGYGGDPHRRVRFPAEVVHAIREAVGPRFVVSLRFSQWKEVDYETGQIVHSPDELKSILLPLRDAGVDMFHASTRRFHRPEWADNTLGLAGWARNVTGCPVITVGGVGILGSGVRNEIRDYGPDEVGEATLGSLSELLKRFGAGEFDLVAVGRAGIGDPDWVAKVAAGRFDEIRPINRSQLLALRERII